MRLLLSLLVAGVACLGTVVWTVRAGFIDVAATEPHSAPVEALLELVRERSVERRAATIAVPPLAARERLAAGARTYEELCAGCHGAPGRERSAVGRGLNPPPPDLSAGIAEERAGEAYWVTAHGIRMSGMPAFAPTLSEERIWDVVALLIALEEMTPDAYAAMLDSPRHDGAHEARGSDPPPGR